MYNESILIVDDSYDMLEVLQRNLKALKFHTYQAGNVRDAIDILEDSKIDLLITDLQMPETGGMHLVNYMAQKHPDIPVLAITGYPSVSGAVEAIKAGALDYLPKPFTTDELKNAVYKSLELRRVNIGGSSQKLSGDKPISYHGIIGNSELIQELSQVIERIKNNKATVLIQGESGTGKELIARAIHYSGKFAKAPFIPVNCGAIPESLLESELFGYVKGAFTGANETRAGFFQAADGGTIFLDEIGNAPHTVQAKLLRVIQEKEVTMIGATRPQKIDVRVIAATNIDLLTMAKRGQFREDLYYRLNVVSIESPPLRNRLSDIPLLVRYFIRKYADEYDRKDIRITERALAALAKYNWPGNVRELENTIQRAVIFGEDTLDIQHLPGHLKSGKPEPGETGKLEPLDEIERRHIEKVLRSVGNNKTKAAEILGIDRKTLRQKLGGQ